MDAVTGLIAASKLLSELAARLKGGDRAQIEILKNRIELAKDQLEFVTRERDSLKQQVLELTQQIRKLEEQAAYRDVDEEFEHGKYNGLLYKKRPDGTVEGPYCPRDRARMTRQERRLFKCPICGAIGQH